LKYLASVAVALHRLTFKYRVNFLPMGLYVFLLEVHVVWHGALSCITYSLANLLLHCSFTVS